MAHGKEDDLLAVVAIEDDVSSATELDDPFAEFGREFFDGAADFRMFAENLDALADGFDGSFGGVAALGYEKGVEAGHVAKGGLGPLQTWQ